jgi:hypothetical protein
MPPRYKSGPKKGQFRKRGSSSTSTRRKRRTARASSKTTYRRRRRRRRNPAGKLDAKGAMIAALGGAVVGGANYALDGVEKITNKQQAWGVAGGGLLLGMLASMVSKPLGQGIAGGALALGGYKLASIYVQKDQAPANGGELGQAAYDPWGRFLGYPTMYPQQSPMLGATTAELSAVEADLGATTAELSAVEADLGAVFADYELG